MNTIMRIATAFAAGATAMYFMDPAVGRRRRALVRDKGVAARHETEAFVRAKKQHLSDRVHGVVAGTRSALASAPVGDRQLHDRIRARLGRLVEQPGEIQVDVQDGHVVLRGTATRGEADALVETVATMRGVTGLDNHLVTLVEEGAPDADGTLAGGAPYGAQSGGAPAATSAGPQAQL